MTLCGWWQACGGGGWKLSASYPIPCPVRLFHLALPESYPFMRNRWSSKRSVFLRSLSHSSRLIHPEGVGESSISRCTGDLDLRLVSEVEGGGDSPIGLIPYCGIWCSPQVDRVRVCHSWHIDECSEPRSSQTLSFWIFMEASISRHDWFSHWPQVIGLRLQSLSPRKGWGNTKFSAFSHIVGPTGNPPPSLGAFQEWLKSEDTFCSHCRKSQRF